MTNATPFPETRYRTATSAAERVALQGDVITASLPLVDELVDELAFPSERRDEAAQVAALGVLVGLEGYDPTSGEPFEHVASRGARRELTMWQERHGESIWFRELPSEHRSRRALHANDKERRAFALALTATPEHFTPKERMAVRAVFLECRPVLGAATHLGVKVGTLAEWIASARRILRVILRRQEAASSV